jgi:hypothetical protein
MLVAAVAAEEASAARAWAEVMAELRAAGWALPGVRVFWDLG